MAHAHDGGLGSDGRGLPVLRDAQVYSIGRVVTRILEIALAAGLGQGSATMSLASSPADTRPISNDAATHAAPGAAIPPAPSALPATASTVPVSKGWHWEVQRLGRRVVRVMPER